MGSVESRAEPRRMPNHPADEVITLCRSCSALSTKNPGGKLTHEERKLTHEDDDHRPSCDDLFCADLHVHLLQSELVVDLHHRRFALRSHCGPVSWVGRSERDAVGTPTAERQVRSLVG